MLDTIFIRAIENEDKGGALSSAIKVLQRGSVNDSEAIFYADAHSFRNVPNAPFAYWSPEGTRDLFSDLDHLDDTDAEVQYGLSTKEDFRFVRTWWEVSPSRVVREPEGESATSREAWDKQTFAGYPWVPFVKGGAYSPFHLDPHLVVFWESAGGSIAARLVDKYPYAKNNIDWILHRESRYYSPGLTWTSRTTSNLSVRALPAGCLFSSKGPAAFVLKPLAILALMESRPFREMVNLQLAAADAAARSYEIGVIKHTPVPNLEESDSKGLILAAQRSVSEKQALDTAREISHLFVRPALLQAEGATLAARLAAHAGQVAEAEAELAEIQAEIDDLAYALYGLSDDDRRALETALPSGAASDDDADADEDDEADVENHVDPAALAHGLVSYALGCAVGRWDARSGSGERPAPPLPDPFAPLPVCSPGMLQGDDGLPLATPPPGYPLDVDDDGVLVDDPDHADDVLARVRAALALFFDDVEAVEVELCELMGEKSLRAYLQKKGGFFKDHASRYSKSRRKAPIYWYLRSAKGNYGLWVYLHRLDGDTLFKALENYVLPKIQLEQNALEGLRVQRAEAGTSGRDAKRLEKALDAQEAFLSELEDFRDKLTRAADLRLTPDLDDGVVLTSAPLHELMPWSEPAKYWKGLLAGDYAWSSIGQQLRDKGLVQDT